MQLIKSICEIPIIISLVICIQIKIISFPGRFFKGFLYNLLKTGKFTYGTSKKLKHSKQIMFIVKFTAQIMHLLLYCKCLTFNVECIANKATQTNYFQSVLTFLIGAGGGGPLLRLSLANCFFNWFWMLLKLFGGVSGVLGLFVKLLLLLFTWLFALLAAPSTTIKTNV